MDWFALIIGICIGFLLGYFTEPVKKALQIMKQGNVFGNAMAAAKGPPSPPAPPAPSSPPQQPRLVAPKKTISQIWDGAVAGLPN